jgi:penicillin-binding protein-related factor A (putative recombinase)
MNELPSVDVKVYFNASDYEYIVTLLDFINSWEYPEHNETCHPLEWGMIKQKGSKIRFMAMPTKDSRPIDN